MIDVVLLIVIAASTLLGMLRGFGIVIGTLSGCWPHGRPSPSATMPRAGGRRPPHLAANISSAATWAWALA